MIKFLPIQGKYILLEIYNQLLNDEQLPREMKKYNVIPILKSNKNPEDYGNYRPIILSSENSRNYDKK